MERCLDEEQGPGNARSRLSFRLSLIVCWLSRCGQARPSGRFSSPHSTLRCVHLHRQRSWPFHHQWQGARTSLLGYNQSNQFIAAQAGEAAIVTVMPEYPLCKSQYNVTAFHHSCHADTLSMTSPSSPTPQPLETPKLGYSMRRTFEHVGDAPQISNAAALGHR